MQFSEHGPPRALLSRSDRSCRITRFFSGSMDMMLTEVSRSLVTVDISCDNGACFSTRLW